MSIRNSSVLGVLFSCSILIAGCDSSSQTRAGASSTGGAGGAGNSGGASFAGGGSSPNALTTVVGPAAVDLLFMVDNSSSMADKQTILAAAVPGLLSRLVQPNCVDSSGKVLGTSQLGAATPCPQGTAEFKPVNNIHIGIVTSSLGDHGGYSICTPGTATSYVDDSGQPVVQPSDENDKGHLIGTLGRAASIQADTAITQTVNLKLDPLGFLAWGDPALQADQSLTSGELGSAQKAFTDMVAAVAERGCGFEAQLESWFRFLIDPVPPVLPLDAPDATNLTHRSGVDDALLAQRAAFLRPNSVLTIVMFTDENDCSIRDTDLGWVPTKPSTSIPASSPACATNPNDKCCCSCSATPPAGCMACSGTTTTATNDGPYQMNIRCWQEKRRFGYEFLYPKSRYVVGLTHAELCPDQTFGDMDCDCGLAHNIGASCSPGSRRMPNPLYSNIVGQDSTGKNVLSQTMVMPRADNSNIFLVGIVGVPWQDVGATDASGNLTYIPVTDPAWVQASATTVPTNPGPAGIWSMIYGDDNANITPGDVHMVESLVPRAGLPGPTAAAGADAIVGHEFNSALEELQYACIYTLPTSRPCQCSLGSSNYAYCKYSHPNECCDLSFAADGNGGPGGDFDKPVCQGNTQVAARAFPGLREIAVLSDYAKSRDAVAAGNSIVTSICPKDLTGDPSSPGYGFNPTMQAIIDRLKDRLPSN